MRLSDELIQIKLNDDLSQVNWGKGNLPVPEGLEK
jgi:hypothetical protein